MSPAGIEWPGSHGVWADLYARRYLALSFWESQERIDRPDIAVNQAECWVFVSVPVFSSGDHVLRSKHFRKTEHIWYWTHDGLVSWFAEQGGGLAEHNNSESLSGRVDIGLMPSKESPPRIVWILRAIDGQSFSLRTIY